MKLCPVCSREYEDSTKFCRNDGSPLTLKTSNFRCPGCQEETDPNKNFCRHCGFSLSMVSASISTDPQEPPTHAQGNSAVLSQEHEAGKYLRAAGPIETGETVGEQRSPLNGQTQCATCGAYVDRNKKFCNHCGGILDVLQGSTTDKALVSYEKSDSTPDVKRPFTDIEATQEKVQPEGSQDEGTVDLAPPQTSLSGRNAFHVAQQLVKEAKYQEAISVLDSASETSPPSQETQLLHLLASVKFYNIYGYEKQIERLELTAESTEKEREIVREILQFYKDSVLKSEDKNLIYNQRASDNKKLEEDSRTDNLSDNQRNGDHLSPVEMRDSATFEPTSETKPYGIHPENNSFTSRPTRPSVQATSKRWQIMLAAVAGVAMSFAGVFFYTSQNNKSLETHGGKKEDNVKPLPPKPAGAQVLLAQALGFSMVGEGTTQQERSTSIINETIKSQLVPIRELYERELEQKPNLHGTITLQFGIAPSGDVMNVQGIAGQSTELGDEQFRQTVIRDAAKWRFPEVQSGFVQVTFPLLFLPRGMDATTFITAATTLPPKPETPQPQPPSEKEEPTHKTDTPAQIKKAEPSSLSNQKKPASVRPVSPPLPPEPRPSTQEPPKRSPPERLVLIPYETITETVVYREPTENSTRITTIPAGTKVHVVHTRGEWLELRSRLGNPPGFIRRDAAAPMGRR